MRRKGEAKTASDVDRCEAGLAVGTEGGYDFFTGFHFLSLLVLFRGMLMSDRRRSSCCTSSDGKRKNLSLIHI